jgi:large subunit ribosomal protein L18e
MKRTGPTNERLKDLVSDLKRQSYAEDAKIWKRIASDLERVTRKRMVVNLSRLNRFTKENDVIVVPGKVLGSGDIGHSLVIAAFAFSENAKQQIEKAKGKCMTIEELAKQNPKGKDVRIIG